jgi:hypothetical protein
MVRPVARTASRPPAVTSEGTIVDVTIDHDLSVRLDRVATKLAAAARRPGEPAMFGASAHRFQLAPPLADSDVVAFEQEHGVSLPADYRAFMSILLVSGPARARIAANGDAPTGPNFTGDADFLGWYERWLDAVLARATHFR